MNTEGLRAFYMHDGCARALLDSMAERKRNPRQTMVTDLEQIAQREGVRHARRDVVATLKRLEELGCGSFVVGRRGQPSRFEWQIDAIALGKAMREPKPTGPVAGENANEGGDEAGDESLTHTYLLRPSVTVRLELPRDLTSKEATRLAEFIRTLPFSDGA